MPPDPDDYATVLWRLDKLEESHDELKLLVAGHETGLAALTARVGIYAGIGALAGGAVVTAVIAAAT